MRKLFLIFVLGLLNLFISVTSVYSQAQFIRAIGGSIAENTCNKIILNPGGGYTLAGWVTRGTKNDNYVVGLDSAGSVAWSSFFGIYTYLEELNSIARTFDGSYVAAGKVETSGAYGLNLSIVKLSSTGNVLWNKSTGLTGTESANSIIQTSDSGFAVLGSTDSYGLTDMLLLKLNSAGTLLWSKTIGGTGADDGYAIVQTADGGYVMVGNTMSFGSGGYDIFIVRLDAAGSLLWSKAIGGTSSDFALNVINTADRGFAVTGYTYSFGAGNSDVYVVKLDSTGNLQWSRTIGGTGGESGNTIIQTSDGGFAIAGSTFSFGVGSTKMYLIKLNSSGNLQWSKTIGGSAENYGMSVIQNPDRGFSLTGNTMSFGSGSYDIMLVKTDSAGNTCGYSATPASITDTAGIIMTANPVVTSVSLSLANQSGDFGYNGITTNVCEPVPVEQLNNYVPSSYTLYQNYPNPFNPSTNIKFDIPKSSAVKLTVYDVLGKEVAVLVNEELKAGTYNYDWDAANYPSGVYFCKLGADALSETKRMILIK